MAQLTAEQLTEMGSSFLVFANAVDEYRMENRAQLSAEENKALKEQHASLCRYADDLFASSAIELGSEVDGSVETIKVVSEKIGVTYNKLKKVQKAIDVAAAGVALGAAIFSRDPKSIKAAVSGLVETVKAEP